MLGRDLCGPRSRARWGLALALGAVLLLVLGQPQQVAVEAQQVAVEAGGDTAPKDETLGVLAAAEDASDSEIHLGRARPADGDRLGPKDEADSSADDLDPAPEPAPLFWEVSGDSPYRFDHPVGEHRPERHALRLQPSIAAGLGVGDRVSLPVPGLGTLVATIEQVETTPLGNRGLSGSIEGLDDAYAVTLTQGHSALFGRITTPGGNYMIEGIGGAASIFKDDLDRLIDPNSTDEVVPPVDGLPPVHEAPVGGLPPVHEAPVGGLPPVHEEEESA